MAPSNSFLVHIEEKLLPKEKNKLRKPVVEKMRRDRINSSIEQLKVLLEKEFQRLQPNSKLEKADILEVAVSYLKQQSQVQARGGYPAYFITPSMGLLPQELPPCSHRSSLPERTMNPCEQGHAGLGPLSPPLPTYCPLCLTLGHAADLSFSSRLFQLSVRKAQSKILTPDTFAASEKHCISCPTMSLGRKLKPS
ncbi:PREDICTED: transcription factor HES-2-like isoform X1 [Crocodylus porosus]|uniref:transcription factor HES-2-like isoform X1 n=1 Tax=Crocodylus porosus TaxID=8502 RepID=UPI000939588D|nr:PREDICTED: transcription factor HES-2-like isoform X1 [Crocodylus porosus]